MIDFKALAEPFDPKDLEWRVQRDGKSSDKRWAMVVCYIDNRAIMNRLDAVCGPGNWRNEFKPWEIGGKHGVLCGISIRVYMVNEECHLTEEEWVTKWDGADPTDIEPIKGGLSDSMKRAAVQWGIGRYLYELDAAFARIIEQKQDGAKSGGNKSDGTYWWLPPILPPSALPKKQEQPKAQPVQQAAVSDADAKAKATQEAKMAGPPTEAQIKAINAIRVVHGLSQLDLSNFDRYRDALVEYNRLKALPIPKDAKAKPANLPTEPAPATAQG